MNLNHVVGVVIALALGALCRWLNIPVPAPPSFYGVLLIFAITVGYIGVDHALRK